MRQRGAIFELAVFWPGYVRYLGNTTNLTQETKTNENKLV